MSDDDIAIAFGTQQKVIELTDDPMQISHNSKGR